MRVEIYDDNDKKLESMDFDNFAIMTEQVNVGGKLLKNDIIRTTNTDKMGLMKMLIMFTTRVMDEINLPQHEFDKMHKEVWKQLSKETKDWEEEKVY